MQFQEITAFSAKITRFCQDCSFRLRATSARSGHGNCAMVREESMKKLISIAFGGLLVGVGFAGAEPYPTRPITIVVPAAAGGSFDTVVRLMAPRMLASILQPTIVEDASGSSGIIRFYRASWAVAD